jgi:hypothetical protein
MFNADIGIRCPFRDDFVFTIIGRSFISGLFRRHAATAADAASGSPMA